MTNTNPLPITGQNYIPRASSVCILQRKRKEDYFTGEAKEPEKNNPIHQKWKLESSLVMSWQLNSVTNERGENFTRLLQ